MNFDVRQYPDRTCIRLPERFDVGVASEFRRAYMDVLGETASQRIELDLWAVRHIDGGAICSLLLFHDLAERYGLSVGLVNCSAVVMEKLKIAGVARIFSAGNPEICPEASGSAGRPASRGEAGAGKYKQMPTSEYLT